MKKKILAMLQQKYFDSVMVKTRYTVCYNSDPKVLVIMWTVEASDEPVVSVGVYVPYINCIRNSLLKLNFIHKLVRICDQRYCWVSNRVDVKELLLDTVVRMGLDTGLSRTGRVP